MSAIYHSKNRHSPCSQTSPECASVSDSCCNHKTKNDSTQKTPDTFQSPEVSRIESTLNRQSIDTSQSKSHQSAVNRMLNEMIHFQTRRDRAGHCMEMLGCRCGTSEPSARLSIGGRYRFREMATPAVCPLLHPPDDRSIRNNRPDLGQPASTAEDSMTDRPTHITSRRPSRTRSTTHRQP